MRMMGRLAQEDLTVIDQEHFIAGHHKIPRIWLVAADRGRCRIFRKPDGYLEQIGEAYPNRKLGRIPNRSMGRVFSSASAFIRHRLQPRKGASEEAAAEFVTDIATWLDNAVKANAFDRLILTASPKMLGDMRKQLTPLVQDRIIAEVNKDLTKINERKLMEELKEIIWF